MPRTDADAVKGILLTDYDTKKAPSLVPFIETANVMTTRVAALAVAAEDPMSATELELLERWLAAHCYCMSDQPYSSRSTGGASGSFQGQTGKGLEATKYGQMALELDPGSYLTATVVGMTWMGKAESERLDYDERN